MKKLSALIVPVALAGAAVGAVAGWLSLKQSTRRYIVHLAKQVPSLPYRYFI
jgi:hypothetical protein